MRAVEGLERRVMLAGFANLDDKGVLRISGTSGADEISIGERSVVVSDLGYSDVYLVPKLGTASAEFYAGAVEKIIIDAGAGNDSITISALSAHVLWILPPSSFIYGGEGNDTISGGDDYGDHIEGGAGDDVLDGRGGADELFGGLGNDTLNGGDSVDGLDGGAGDDVMNGGAGNDVLRGAEGHDQLDGGGGDDLLHGSDGETDTLSGGDGYDQAFVDQGLIGDSMSSVETVLGVSGGTLTLEARPFAEVRIGAQSDVLLLRVLGMQLETALAPIQRLQLVGNTLVNDTSIPSTMTGGTVYGGGGPDVLFGVGEYHSDVYGRAGNDTLTGSVNGGLDGGDGDDTLISGGSMYLIGGSGNDRIYGGGAVDSVNGGDGNDTIYGGAGNDILEGSAGRDRIYGEDGDDFIRAQDGERDTIYGGSGENLGVYEDGELGDRVVEVQLQDVTRAWITRSGTLMVRGTNGRDVIQVTKSGSQVTVVADPARLYSQALVFPASRVKRLSVDCGDGRDFVGIFFVLPNTLVGGAGNDSLKGGAGGDFLIGGSGVDTIQGAGGNDTIVGGGSRDKIYGGDGDDVIYARDSNIDYIHGGAGRNVAMIEKEDAGRQDLVWEIESYL
jgi:Ca2+-binding RTX toxin-like protein